MEFFLVWVAKLYGYYTITNLVKENFTLILVIGAFIGMCLVFFRLLNRTFPKPGREPFKRWAMKFVLIFISSSFVFIMLFSLFYEVRKSQEQTAVPYIQFITIA